MAPPHDMATRAQVVTLKALGLKNSEIERQTGIKTRTINSIYDRAIQRGFDPNAEQRVVHDNHVQNASRPGRPSKQTEDIKEDILNKVRQDRYGREKTCAYIAAEMGGISAMTVWRVLRKAGMKKTKPTRKPGLTKKMKEERLAFCRHHQHWTLEDWKNVIWSDETSIILLYRAGGYRIWRSSKEALLKSCIRERWKGYSEFMFWGCFSYDKKGPYHIWQPETATERKKAELSLTKLNEELEPIMQEQWELNIGIERLGLQN